LLSAQAQAAIVSGPDVIAAISVQEDGAAYENTAQQGFNEQQSVFLNSAINVDGGTVAAGQTVDSHLIFLNTDGGTAAYDRQKWTFDGKTLGVISGKNGGNFNASNTLLAAFNDYFTVGSNTGAFDNLGLEQNNLEAVNKDGYLIMGLMGNMLDLSMYVTEPGDWVRVVTVSEVPVPAALFLFAPALLGFLGLRKKAKAA
jgi:hypothetical protein